MVESLFGSLEWWKEQAPNMNLEELQKDLSDHWKCVLCGYELVLKYPAVIGMVCCGNCGQSTLRPIYDFKGD